MDSSLEARITGIMYRDVYSIRGSGGWSVFTILMCVVMKSSDDAAQRE